MAGRRRFLKAAAIAAIAVKGAGGAHEIASCMNDIRRMKKEMRDEFHEERCA